MAKRDNFLPMGTREVFGATLTVGKRDSRADVLNIGIALVKEASKPAVRWLWKHCLHERRRMGETG